MKPTNFYGFQARDFAGFTLKSAHFRSFKTAFISWFHLAACGSAATPPAVSSKAVNIKAETHPDPPVMGDIELILTVTDANGNPIEGATVDVSADHTDMTGMSMSGAATEQGSGKYSIKANFSMSGNWKIKVYVRKEGLDYSEEIDLPVQ